MAAGEGFEPSHTESESAVLPLHNPAKRKSYYTEKTLFVKIFFVLREQGERGAKNKEGIPLLMKETDFLVCTLIYHETLPW